MREFMTIPAGVGPTGMTHSFFCVFRLIAITSFESCRVMKTYSLPASKAMCDGVRGACRRALSLKSAAS